MTELSIQNFVSEIHALNTKIQIIAQRMKIIERNEEIIGKTLISHNKTIKELEEAVSKLKTSPPVASKPSSDEVAPDTIENIKKTLAEMQTKVNAAKTEADENKEELAKIESDIKEIKYILENFNPLTYVTIEDVANIVDDKINAILKKKKEEK